MSFLVSFNSLGVSFIRSTEECQERNHNIKFVYYRTQEGWAQYAVPFE